MDSTNEQIERVLANFRSWFEESVRLIQEVKPGERIPITVLSERVAAKFGMKGTQLYPVLRLLVDHLTIPGFKRVKAGAQGGWLRETTKDTE